MIKILDRITSTKNEKIKNVVNLQKARERRDQNVFLIEGIKELEKAVLSGYKFRTVFYCAEIISETELNRLLGSVINAAFEVSREVYEKIAYRENVGGVVALVEPGSHGLDDLNLPENPLLLVMEGVEKPGNLGALLRTADAAGIDAVIVCDPQTDLYNPNVVRASLGCLFTVPIAIADSETAIHWMRNKGIQIFCTYLQAASPYHLTDFQQPSAIVMGTEATGITEVWVRNATKNIIIPMHGAADSLNVSTAAAIVMFEARRQRGFN